MYKQILDYEEEVTPESPAHLFCDVCGKPIGEMHSGILLATDHTMVNGLPRHFIVAHKGVLNASKTAWTRRPCSSGNENEYPVSDELTYNMIYKMSLLASKYQKKYRVLEPA